MRRYIIRGGIAIAALFLFCDKSNAQLIELACPAGTTSVQSLQTIDTTNGQLRQNYCVDKFGKVFENINSASLTGDALFGSGRPWFDVMAPPFNAKNDNVTDDTASIQLAITTACSASPPGGIIYFPRGPGYRTANTNTTPFNVTCSNITFKGTQFTQADNPVLPPSTIEAPNLTVPLFLINSSSVFGTRWEDLGFEGNSTSSGAIAISITNCGTGACGSINHNFFDNWGGPVIQSFVGASIMFITENWVQGCLLQRPAATDTGCFDLGNNDLQLRNNFVTPSVPTAAGNIGAGHTYSYALRGSVGFVTNNMAEISQHGYLITGNYIKLTSNRCFLMQGQCIHITGKNNVLDGAWTIMDSSQTATNTFDAVLCDGTCVSNIFDGFMIDDDASGNGNHTRNGFTDNNSNGAGYTVGNYYGTSNRFGGTGPVGVLYNMIGASPYSIAQGHKISPDRGDSSVTLQCGIDAETQYFNTPLTATRTVTLSTTGAWNGCRFRIVRTSLATSGFPLASNIGGNLGPGQQNEFEFNGSWQEVNNIIFASTTLNNAILQYQTDGRANFSSAPGTLTIASGTAAMTTAAIAAGACGTTVTVAAANVLSTDAIIISFNAAPAGTNAGLTSWPTAGNVNFAYCPGVAETPAAATINWKVVR